MCHVWFEIDSLIEFVIDKYLHLSPAKRMQYKNIAIRFQSTGHEWTTFQATSILLELSFQLELTRWNPKQYNGNQSD